MGSTDYKQRSGCFPEGFLDQPFYGWVTRRNLKY
jgi:hypothetical protein